MNRVVTVSTGARLHFGLIVARGDRGPRFGSVGLMVDEPGFTVRVEPATDRDVIVAPARVAERVAEFLQIWRAASQKPRGCNPWASPEAVRVEITRVIPEHAGLGSGTQLAMALGTALSTADSDPLALPERMQRGRRSQIGIAGFRSGGMHATGLSSPDLHANVPEAWRFLLITPPQHAGLSGTAEQRAFQQMPPMRGELCDRLNRLVLDTWWPALLRADFDTFSTAMYDFGVSVGEYFAPYQGGAFAHPQMARLVEHLCSRGINGVAQTSWGPTIAVLCADVDAALALADDLRRDARWSDCTLRIAAPLNRGATVTRDV